jgi:hypothetical protein
MQAIILVGEGGICLNVENGHPAPAEASILWGGFFVALSRGTMSQVFWTDVLTKARCDGGLRMRMAIHVWKPITIVWVGSLRITTPNILLSRFATGVAGGARALPIPTSVAFIIVVPLTDLIEVVTEMGLTRFTTGARNFTHYR